MKEILQDSHFSQIFKSEIKKRSPQILHIEKF